jgi:hypothetical protein
MSVEGLTGNSMILMRDQASLDYLQAGHDSDPSNAFARLTIGNLTMLQPSLYFQVKSTGVNGYWVLKTASGKYLKVNTEPGPKQDQIQWVSINPASETVVDKSPYYWSFLRVPLSAAPALYVMQTYYNGGMTLQQPEGPGTDILLAAPQLTPGRPPELSFEVGVTSGPTVGSVDPILSLMPMMTVETGATGDSSDSASDIVDPTSSSVDPWAIALIVVMCVVVALMLGYLGWMAWKSRTKTSSSMPQMRVGGADTVAGSSITLSTKTNVETYRVPSANLLMQPVPVAVSVAGAALRRVAQLTATEAPLSDNGQGSFGL